MSLSNALNAMARSQPGHPALHWDGGSLDYAGFEDQVARIAGALKARGLPAGARIAMVLDNCPEFLPVLLGIWRAGMTAIPINVRLHAREQAWIMQNAGAALCLAATGFAPGLVEVAQAPVLALDHTGWSGLISAEPVARDDNAPDDAAWIFYTSGTTGRPKGAILTHRNLMAASLSYLADVDFIGPEDIRLHAAPMTHGSGLYALPFVLKGAQHVLIPPGFDPDRIFRELRTRRNVSFFAAPTMISRLIHAPVAQGAEVGGLKTLEYGGAPMYLADLRRALEVFGPRLYHLYGQGESPMTITHVTKAMHARPGNDDLLASVGIARSGCEISIVDDDWRHQPAGTVGEIATRGDCVMAGYLDNPEATARALRGGWLKTGDIGVIDQAGVLRLMDRSKDMIISGGLNIYPREIEEVLLTHPDVLECAVVSRPDPDWGEAVVAFVVPRQTAPDIAVLDRLCLDHLARYKRPKDWRIVDDLPKNNYGKIVKTTLREQLRTET